MKVALPARVPSNHSSYVETQEAHIAMDICADKVLKIPAALINEVNALGADRAKTRNALKTAVKVLMDYMHEVDGKLQPGKYRPEEWLERMEDPPQPENGNVVRQYRFLKPMSKNEDAARLYVEFNGTQLHFLSVRDEAGKTLGNLPERGVPSVDIGNLPAAGKSARSNSLQQALIERLSNASSPSSPGNSAVEEDAEDLVMEASPRKESSPSSPTATETSGSEEDAAEESVRKENPRKRLATSTIGKQPPLKRLPHDMSFFPDILNSEEAEKSASAFCDQILAHWDSIRDKKSKETEKEKASLQEGKVKRLQTRFRGEVLPEAAAKQPDELRTIFNHNATRYEAYKKALFEGTQKGFFDGISPRAKNPRLAMEKFVLARIGDVEDFLLHLSKEVGIDLGKEGCLDEEAIQDIKSRTETYRRATYRDSPAWDSVNDFLHWLEHGNIVKPEVQVKI